MPDDVLKKLHDSQESVSSSDVTITKNEFKQFVKKTRCILK